MLYLVVWLCFLNGALTIVKYEAKQSAVKSSAVNLEMVGFVKLFTNPKVTDDDPV